MALMDGLYGWPLWNAVIDGPYGWPLWMAFIDGPYGWQVCMAIMDGPYGWFIADDQYTSDLDSGLLARSNILLALVRDVPVHA